METLPAHQREFKRIDKETFWLARGTRTPKGLENYATDPLWNRMARRGGIVPLHLGSYHRRHTHVIPGEGFAPDETNLARVGTKLQQQA